MMVRLPDGAFVMGSPEEERQLVLEVARERGSDLKKFGEYIDRERPQHEVPLSAFLIAKYELSQSVWESVMENNPSETKGRDLPVTNVSWDDCQAFCEKTGLKLPTEAQWEYACRSGKNSAFAFGVTVSTDQANFDGSLPFGGSERGEARGSALAVDSLNPNGFGLHHLHGNVREWCQDFMRPDFYSLHEASERDPVCTKSLAPRTTNRAVRGGSWQTDAVSCRSASRSRRSPEASDGHLGFRVAYYPVP